MGRAPCCEKTEVKRGPWSPDEDEILKNYLHKYGNAGNWITLPHKAGLKRCGKSCRLRWLNYLRPNIKHGAFSDEEDNIICTLYTKMGSRWSVIASQLPGRTDNDVKNHWNTKLKKKLMAAQNNPSIHTNNYPTPSSALVPKIEAHNSYFSTQNSPAMPSVILDGGVTVNNTQVGSTISGSSSLALEENYGGLNEGFLVDFGSGFSYDFSSGIWSQEAVLEAVDPTNFLGKFS